MAGGHAVVASISRVRIIVGDNGETKVHEGDLNERLGFVRAVAVRCVAPKNDPSPKGRPNPFSKDQGLSSLRRVEHLPRALVRLLHLAAQSGLLTTVHKLHEHSDTALRLDLPELTVLPSHVFNVCRCEVL